MQRRSFLQLPFWAKERLPWGQVVCASAKVISTSLKEFQLAGLIIITVLL